MSAHQDVARTARQLGWVGIGIFVVGMVIGTAGGSGGMAVFGLLGFLLFVGCQYLVGKYGSSD